MPMDIRKSEVRVFSELSKARASLTKRGVDQTLLTPEEIIDSYRVYRAEWPRKCQTSACTAIVRSRNYHLCRSCAAKLCKSGGISASTRSKLSAASRGKKKSPEHIQSLKDAWNSPGTKERRRHTPEVRQKMSVSQSRVQNLPEKIEKRREITRKSWENPEIRSKRIEGSLRSFTPEVKALLSKNCFFRTEEGLKLIRAKNSSLEAIEKNRERGIARWSDPVFIEKYGKTTRASTKYKCGKFKSVKNNCEIGFRSLYEVYAYRRLEHDESVISYGYCGFSIPYIFNNKERRYVPDILVSYNSGAQHIIEVKPKVFVTDPEVVAKSEAATEYCKRNNMVYEIWTEQEISNMENKS